jgi:DNA-binding response OmpR family regulator
MDNARPQETGGNLLVVDDDLLVRQTLEALLTREGFEVRCAPNGRMALIFAAEDPPELVLLDIRLPDMEGYQVCRHLKEDPKTSNIPVIFLSGLDEVADKVRGFAAGGVDYIAKPFHREEVLARVESHLELKRAREALKRVNEELEERVAGRTAELAERLRFEELISNLSAKFVNLPSDRVDLEIEDALEQIRGFFGVDRIGLLRVLRDKTVWQITHAAHADDIPPLPVGRDLPIGLFPWVYRKIIEQREVWSFARIEDLPPEAGIDQHTDPHFRRFL